MDERFERLEHEVCQCLRYKSMFVAMSPDPKVLPTNDNNYWCVLTQMVLGPDDRVVEPAACKPGRSCYYVILD